MEKSKEFELIKDKDEELGVDAHNWYGKEDQTDYNDVHDIGKGEPITIRLFEWSLKPDLDKLPTKEEILTPEYLKHLQTELWADALRLVMEPRIVITKEKIQIFAPCQARTGQSFLDQPKLLQEWIK